MYKSVGVFLFVVGAFSLLLSFLVDSVVFASAGPRAAAIFVSFVGVVIFLFNSASQSRNSRSRHSRM